LAADSGGSSGSHPCREATGRERRQFELGLRTSTEVLEVIALLANAQSREIRALAAYEIAQIDIAFATGTVLGKSGVTFEPKRYEP
jgi:outer membrane protein TolC